MDKKRDIFFDTKAGRAFLCLMSLLLIVGGVLIIYLSSIEKEWGLWSILLAAGCKYCVLSSRRYGNYKLVSLVEDDTIISSDELDAKIQRGIAEYEIGKAIAIQEVEKLSWLSM